VDWRVMLFIAVFGTLIQHLNHANIRFDWGPLRFVLNSPMMHVWHHDMELHGKGGQNFGIVLSVWDWVFGTVYWPKKVDQPEELGFEGMNRYPRGLIPRFAYPFYKVFYRSADNRHA
jgi:sterol desaturase/sphingolipid hydroxylase (fatty acid hydroxylase superfamily)